VSNIESTAALGASNLAEIKSAHIKDWKPFNETIYTWGKRITRNGVAKVVIRTINNGGKLISENNLLFPDTYTIAEQGCHF